MVILSFSIKVKLCAVGFFSIQRYFFSQCSGSFFGDSKNNPERGFCPENKFRSFTTVGRMGRSGFSGSFFGMPIIKVLSYL